MNARAFLVIVAIYTALYGLGLLLAPGKCAAFFGLAPDASLQLFGRTLGAVMIGLAITFWYARDATMGTMAPAAKGVMYGGCTANVLGLIVAGWAALAGAVGPSAWIVVIIQAVIAIGFMYFAEFRRGAPAM